jgi:mannose-6-phosphate isomerase
MERVWGGRMLHEVYGRALPQGGPIGESWEVVDRDPEQSIVDDGPLAGLTLHQLWTRHKAEVFGRNAPRTPHFPLLIKILDARDTLSIQVHPPASVAESLGGEPKTEMWYIAHAEPDAALYVGVREGVNRSSFANAVAAGTVEQVVHRLPVRAGQFLFVPSGRLHAIGAGLLIFDIPHNSDTTFRVYYWNRLGLDGKPRARQVAPSLASIDFEDTSPSLGVETDGLLVRCPYFEVRRLEVAPGAATMWGQEGDFSILATVDGDGTLGDTRLTAGDVVLVPASVPDQQRELHSSSGATLLATRF